MALVLANRIQETTTTTGTGTITLAGAVAGFQSFSVIGNANTTYYTITSGNAWEVGIGTYSTSGTTLARTTILSSSAGGAAITLAGTSTVFSSYPAEKVISSDYGTLPVANGGTGQTTYTNGQLLIGNTTGNTLTKATLSAGTNINVTNSTGSITINATGLMPLSAINALGNQTGSISIDISAHDTFSVTLTGNLTISSFTNRPSNPYGFTIITTQDATGGRSITWPTGSKYAGGVAPPITTTANAVDIWNVYTYNSGSFYVVSLAVKDSK
jgi:hypothetical protein